MSQFYPYTIHTVCRMDSELCHYNTVSPVKTDKRILHRQTFQNNRICLYFQIRVIGVMPFK